jgi:hypothetical protein
MCCAHWNNKLHSNDIPRGVRLSFAPKISLFVLELYMRKSSGGATKAVVGEADYLACCEWDLCYLTGEHTCEGRAKALA